MKKVFLSALIAAGMAAAIFQIPSGSEAARAPVDYPLVCRGGGTLVIGIAPGEGKLGFTFTHGIKPASEGLNPGECSWVDRRMYDAEPGRVSQSVEEVVGAPKPGWYEELRSSDKYWTFMVSNNGKGQLIATSARPGGVDVSPTKTTGFTPVPDGAKTWEWATAWKDVGGLGGCGDFEADAIDTSAYFSKVAGQITAGFLHHWDGGHPPIRCRERKTSEFVGTVWFDLSEIFSKPALPKAEYAMLTFKAIESDGPGGVCKDELRLPADDWMRGLPKNTLPKTGSLEPAVYFEGCPAAGCSFEVTSIVNNWITGREDRYGFAISGLDDIAAIGAEDGKYPDNNAHCTTRYGDFRLTVTYKYSEPPVIIAIPPKPDRKNVALASNGATASAQNFTADGVYPGLHFQPLYAIDGLRHTLSDGGNCWRDEHGLPSYLEVVFNGLKTIDEIDVITIQVPDYEKAEDPADRKSFTSQGATNFEVKYWTGSAWKSLGESIIGNSLVVRKITFSPIKTSKIRLFVTNSSDRVARIVELEAWGS